MSIIITCRKNNDDTLSVSPPVCQFLDSLFHSRWYIVCAPWAVDDICPQRFCLIEQLYGFTVAHPLFVFEKDDIALSGNTYDTSAIQICSDNPSHSRTVVRAWFVMWNIGRMCFYIICSDDGAIQLFVHHVYSIIYDSYGDTPAGIVLEHLPGIYARIGIYAVVAVKCLVFFQIPLLMVVGFQWEIRLRSYVYIFISQAIIVIIDIPRFWWSISFITVCIALDVLTGQAVVTIVIDHVVITICF